MSGMNFVEALYLAVLLVPLAFLLVGIFMLPIVVGTVFIRDKLLHHH